MSSQYIDRKTAAKTYRPASGTMSEGLKRARAPYRVRNALVGLGLGAFAVGVWAYSISAVKQDVFDDVDEEARALGAGTGVGVGAAGEGVTTVPSVSAAVDVALVTPGPTLPLPPVLPPVSSTPVRGILQGVVGSRWPRVMDPERKTVVWGAPSLDNVGTMGGKLS